MHKAVEVLMYSIIILSSYNFSMMHGKPAEDASDDVSEDENVGFIYPGTKWCGAGDDAKNYDDLGKAKEADMCCRDHDHCPDYIAAGKTKYNLTNDASYTRLNCECDEAFHKCLHKANTTVSKDVGFLYFDALGTQCYRKDYKATGCTKHGGWGDSKCLEHTYDNSSTPTYQWFDVSEF